MVSHRFHIDGMTCTGCEAILKREVGTIDGIEHVEADHETGIVEFSATQATAGGYVEQVIIGLGYAVTEYTTA